MATVCLSLVFLVIGCKTSAGSSSSLAESDTAATSDDSAQSEELPDLGDLDAFLPQISELETVLQYKEAAGANRKFCTLDAFKKGILMGTGKNNLGWNIHFIKTGDRLCVEKYPGTIRLDQDILGVALKLVPASSVPQPGQTQQARPANIEVCEVKVKFRCMLAPTDPSQDEQQPDTTQK